MIFLPGLSQNDGRGSFFCSIKCDLRTLSNLQFICASKAYSNMEALFVGMVPMEQLYKPVPLLLLSAIPIQIKICSSKNCVEAFILLPFSFASFARTWLRDDKTSSLAKTLLWWQL